MPLIPRNGGERHRIEITAEIDPHSVGDWYEIKTMLGYYERMQASGLRGGSIKLPARRFKTGDDLAPDEVVSMTMDNVAEATHVKLCIWLTGWSHDEKLQSATVRRMPESHVKAVLAAIEQYEADQGGPQRDSPLPSSSTE